MNSERTASRQWAASLMLALLCISAGQLPAQNPPEDITGLPLRFNAPVAPAHSKFVAVVLSGDGGFASLVNKLSAGLAAQGIGVVEFNSREWLSPAKTPEQSAVAVARALRAGMSRFRADSIVIVGYSRGADMAPFVANRLPADLRKVLGGVAMFGVAKMANFEFHIVDLIKDTERASDIPILPELEKLRGTRLTCVYGSEEKASACRDAPASLMHVEVRNGGHHFDGADDTLAEVVLRMLREPWRVQPGGVIESTSGPRGTRMRCPTLMLSSRN